MSVSDTSTPHYQSSWPWSAIVAFLILGSAALRIAYLAHDCPLDLAPDEAHYWDWSRHLDWSYYSKGPLVAYLIRFSVTVAGAWSERLTGNCMLAVRLPAVACGSLLLFGLYVLTRQIYGRASLGAGVVVAVGFSGHGFKMASSLGAVAADLISEGTTTTDVSFMDPARFLPPQHSVADIPLNGAASGPEPS